MTKTLTPDRLGRKGPSPDGLVRECLGHECLGHECPGRECLGHELDSYVLGMVLFAALILGGGTGPDLVTDSMIAGLIVVAATAVIWLRADRPVDRGVMWCLSLAVCAVLAQLVPVPDAAVSPSQGAVPDAFRDRFAADWRPVTLGVGQTIEAMAWLLTLALFLVALLKLRFEQVVGLIPFFLAGVLSNMAAALIQYSLAHTAHIEGVLPHVMRAGFFSNENHFSALVFVSIPVAFVWFAELRRPGLLFLYLAFSLIVLLAAGSRAGILIGLAVTVLSALVMFQRSRTGILAVFAGAGLIGVYGMGVLGRLRLEPLSDPDFGRTEFARTTLAGIADNMPFGVGYGNFVTAYSAYERPGMVFGAYVNHAHNDYLELVFEGGLAAALLIAAFLVLFLRQLVRTIRLPVHRAASVAVFFILLHSLVDYPLRTMAVSATFCLLLGVLFHARSAAATCNTRQSVTVRTARGNVARVPMTVPSKHCQGTGRGLNEPALPAPRLLAGNDEKYQLNEEFRCPA